MYHSSVKCDFRPTAKSLKFASRPMTDDNDDDCNASTQSVQVHVGLYNVYIHRNTVFVRVETQWLAFSAKCSAATSAGESSISRNLTHADPTNPT